MMKRMPRIKDVMRAFPFSIQAAASIQDARQMMDEHNVSHLPVMDGENLISVISMKELERVRLPGHRHTDFDSLSVGDLCPINAYVVDLHVSLIEVLEHMADEHVDCALVTRHNKLAGIFTFSGACRAYAEHLKEEFFPPGGDNVA
jgi:CBS domain-containing protein